MGRSYERRELFGGAPLENQLHSSIIVQEALGSRVSTGKRIGLQDIHSPSWVAGTGRVIAKFEDGSVAILVNSYGKGKTITILPSASDAAQDFPELVRDAIDFALGHAGTDRAADLLGTDARMDVATEKRRDGFAVAVVNHNSVEKDVTVRPLKPDLDGVATWIDSVNGTRLPASDQKFLKLRIPAGGFRAVEFKQKVSAKDIALPPNFSVPEHSHE
jgi:hypothetical protein